LKLGCLPSFGGTEAYGKRSFKILEYTQNIGGQAKGEGSGYLLENDRLIKRFVLQARNFALVGWTNIRASAEMGFLFFFFSVPQNF